MTLLAQRPTSTATKGIIATAVTAATAKFSAATLVAQQRHDCKTLFTKDRAVPPRTVAPGAIVQDAPSLANV